MNKDLTMEQAKILEQMQVLVDELNIATRHYDEGNPIMSDAAWDQKYYTLYKLEQESGMALVDSPTQKVVYEVVNSLEKVEHNHPMLSLAKTKSINELKSFLGDSHQFITMLKMDGLTCSLTYDNHKLVRAETRGDGYVGENILHNIRVNPTVPKWIPLADTITIDGEIICRKDIFEEHFADTYKNPRNFAAGSIRLLDSEESAKRALTFVAWDWINDVQDEYGVELTLSRKLETLKDMGFITVPYSTVQTPEEAGYALEQIAMLMHYPIDGLVYKFDDCEYYRSLGSTSHHPAAALAFKFYDEVYETTLLDIDWTMGRTGKISPVAVFQPVEIGGSTVERANLHNISIMMELCGGEAYVGDRVGIYRANEIIPQVSTWTRGEPAAALTIPTKCPVCGGEVAIQKEKESEVLMCMNPSCEGKLLNKLDYTYGKKGLDVKGLSKATLEKLMDWGWVNELSDIYTLHEHRDEWVLKPGFGPKSVDKILNSIEASKHPTLEKFIASIGIRFVGTTLAKELVKFIDSYEDFRTKVDENYNFAKHDKFALEKTKSILNFDYEQADKIYEYVKPLQEKGQKAAVATDAPLSGLKFCVTGKLEHFKNRAELQTLIEQNGGKVVSSVSKTVNYLINNDNTSSSNKNLTAKEYGISIITENDLLDLLAK